MFVDLYALQAVPPSNINRDDTGSPKTAYYGGTLRSRVSSQAWKKAMRKEFRDTLPADKVGYRTKMAVSLIQQAINGARPDLAERSEELATAVLEVSGLKVEASTRAGVQSGAPETQYLIFVGANEVDGLAQVAINWADQEQDLKKPSAAMKKEVLAVFHGVKALDIALFGRMLADIPQLNEDASAQVAHAISVDKVAQEYDYFTAVDECAPDDNAGAAMIDTVGFNSSTLYRYATVNIDSLVKQLGDPEAAAQGVVAFAEAFIRSMPTGKQNSFANRTLPSTVVIALRDRQPINVVDAFQDAIRPEAGESVARKAAQALGSKLADVEQAYDAKPVKAWNIVTDKPVEELDAVSEHVDLARATTELGEAVLASLGKGQE
ncbi:CRISPR-associated protein, Cse4 family [Bifidobacterium actinocoloniiforme DSM 22766]|uniref:CRISPR-associated protein, Cse4 family n=1 Tax=Bifidobacterium actinocoloniiforme DSM 22766 TaxID=1437605 RepID=A0A086YYJ0_9BIFI|nr:type I-E CRISPR-associated protein Cas7/Cse4/CasC [Bifidobacterium actinocoloniiforme]AKV55874.1 CRISPR-associated protein Cse4 [Bifidobacterium actinocoloniiforme DSM 22766]KFI39340.1 CRISPR-associated protein, Cse4 family [Bifidobacterium actinocoloniiforme DSM 22766]